MSGTCWGGCGGVRTMTNAKAFPAAPRRGVRHLPLWLLMAWLLATVSLFVFGPYDYHLPNATALYLYLTAVHVALFAGYLVGVRLQPGRARTAINGAAAVKFCLVITFALTAAKLAYSQGGDLGRLSTALIDPAESYLAGSTKSGAMVFNYLEIFTAPIMALALIWGIYYWPRLNALYRATLAALIGLSVLSSIGASVRSTMVVTGLMAFASFLASCCSGNVRLGFIAKAAVPIVLGLALAGFFVYYSFLAERRSDEPEKLINLITREYPVEDAPLYRIVPETYRTTYVSVAFYVSHGYARLAQALDLPFIGIGYGAGNSAFLVRNVIRLTGWDWFEQRSYGLRLDRETGTGDFGGAWSTAYTWIASDATFPGSVLVVFLIGLMLGGSWAGVLHGSGPLAVAAFGCLFIVVFSFPMNNPIQDGPGLATYAGIPLLWLLNHAGTTPAAGRPR